MRTLTLGLVAIALALASPTVTPPVLAHGGHYRGPHGEVPPDSRGPEDPPPPDTDGGTPTPPPDGGGTPTPPPDGSGGTPTPPPSPPPDSPAPGTGGTPPPAGPGPGTRTGGRQARKGPSYESWLFWWAYNKDEILNLKSRLRDVAVTGGAGTGVLVTGAGENKGAIQNVTARAVEQEVVPVLKRFARDSKVHADIQSAAVLALAKIGRKEEVPYFQELARNKDGAVDKIVEESAALALGIMQNRDAAVRKFLSEVALDGDAKYRTRCFAIFSLGLLGDREGAYGGNAESLQALRTIVTTPQSSKDVANSALSAMGLLGDRGAVKELTQWLQEEKAGNEKFNDLTLSYVAAALGKIGQPGFSGPESHEVVDALKDVFRRKNRMTTYSATIAFGQIAPQGDAKVQKDCVAILSNIVTSKDMDTQAQCFALASLGRIAGAKPAADGSGGCPADVREKALGTLLKALDSSRQLQTRSFAALGLGLAAMDLDQTEKAPLQEKIRNTLARTSGDVEARGALCIALGMLRDKVAAPQLEEILKNEREAKLRGTAAVALGLVGERAAQESVRAALGEKEPELRVDAAIAAGLLRDGNAVPMLVAILQDDRSSQFVLGSVAMALGQIGDQRAVTPLREILENGSDFPVLTRALAAVALGQVGDKTDIPVLSRVSSDVNYRAYYDAIGELLTII